MARVVVTGGCGFIGANLVPLLREARHDVVIVDNLSRGDPAYLDGARAYTLVNADIRNSAAMEKAVAGADAIVHLAAYGSVVESVADPAENYSINVEGTFSVLSAARRAGVRRFVFSSTGGALIGNATPPVSESSVPRPISPYGASKLAGEGYCCAFAHSYDMSVTALRFANVVGPLSWHKKGAVTAFFKAIMGEQPIRIFGDGSATRDFLYVGDLCRGITAALDAQLPGYTALHLASGREVSVKELARIACDAASAPDHPIVFDARRKGEVERNFASYELAEKTLGFRPRVPLEEGMRATWSWFSEYAQRSGARA
jgi:UDP-glucose 4-epimerase